MDTLKTAFENLDRWRHLPNYQLERRADVFFSVYIKDVVERHTKVPLISTVIPELPLKRDLLHPERPSSKSVKVDYVLFAEDRSKVFFVELKTAMGSRRDDQDIYLKEARKVGFKCIVEGIRDIMLRTTEHGKYFHLADTLAQAGFMELPADLADYVFPAPLRGLREKLKAIQVSGLNPPIQVIYLQPNRQEGVDCIDFEEVAQHLDGKDDELSRLFSEHLRRWVQTAGSSNPSER